MSTCARRPRAGRLAVMATIVLAVTLSACGAATRAAPGTATPRSAARTFLTDYVDADGRVVRHDQGGDTVSEGQAYALLLDVAVDDPDQFATVWSWSRAPLLQPDGLLAYHWAGGRVADDDPASDADLDIARALVLGGDRWHEPALARQGDAYAAAILANETASAGGRLWLVAGPWARRAPLYADPSYADPATFALLAGATHDARWSAVAASSVDLLRADTDDGRRLPSDWATIDRSGIVQPSPPPGGGATLYSYDAFRTLVRQDDACAPGAPSRIDALLAPLSARTASPDDRADTYNTDGTPSQGGDNPLMLIAAAGAARAAGHPSAVTGYLAAAAAAAERQPTYYLDAWVALGRTLLTTDDLAHCPTT